MGGIISNIEPDRIKYIWSGDDNVMITVAIHRDKPYECLSLSMRSYFTTTWIDLDIKYFTFKELMNVATNNGQIKLPGGVILSAADMMFKYNADNVTSVWPKDPVTECLRLALLESQKHGYTYKQ
jgi:hypothetical protein